MSPITSSPGWLWLFWLKANSDDQWLENLKKLKAQSSGLGPDWSTSYGLFQTKKTDFTFSYVTSLIYHWRDEKADEYQAVEWPGGHPMQVEYVLIPERAHNKAAAQKFVQLMLSTEGQLAIRDKNFMYSVRSDLTPNELEAKLPQLKLLPMTKHSEFINNKRNWLEQFEKSWF